MLPDFTSDALTFLSSLFIFVLGTFALAIVLLFLLDISQTKDAIRHNYPVIGRFRILFSSLGEFFRQYFFAMDREEMPFNRAEREWVYRSSAGNDNTVAFGSTKNISPPGTTLFVNCPFPTLDEQAVDPPPVIIGPQCPQPYEAASLINISAMSYGALSKPAIQTLSMGARQANCWLNTGEGGLSDYHLQGKCDLVFQIGTAKYGVRTVDGQLDENKLSKVAKIPQIKMFEIKISQGAKPGKGGILPGVKVTEEIARIRGIPPWQDSISPNRHPEIGSTIELLDFINRIRDITGKPTGFKIVVGAYDWLETLCKEIHYRGILSAPDFITIDSADGGSGAAPMPLMDDVGLPIRESLLGVIDILCKYGLRERIKVIASGKLITPTGVAWAMCAGADFVASARGFMFSMGCIQALKCNKNTCPTGITTHNPHLQSGLDPVDKALHIKNFVARIHYGVGLIAHSCGVAHPRLLCRHHCRIVQENSSSLPLDEIHPNIDTLEEYTAVKKEYIDALQNQRSSENPRSL